MKIRPSFTREERRIFIFETQMILKLKAARGIVTIVSAKGTSVRCDGEKMIIR